MERIIRELRGDACLGLEETPEPRQEITSNRSFGRQVKTYEELREAVMIYTARAGEKLRRDGSVAGGMRAAPPARLEPPLAVAIRRNVSNFAQKPLKFETTFQTLVVCTQTMCRRLKNETPISAMSETYSLGD